LGFLTSTWATVENNGTNVINAGSLSAPAGLPVAGGHAQTDSPVFNRHFYSMDQDGDGLKGEWPDDALQTGVHWLSFLARGDVNSDFGGLSLVKFFGDEILYIGKIGGNGGTEWGVDTGGNPQAVAGSDITQDTFLVAKLTLGGGSNDDTVDLFINPALGSTPPLIADLTANFNEEPGGTNRTIDEIRLASQNGPFFADEIRIGTTFADVALPEPGTGVLVLGLAAIASSARRRRRT
jgi:hypothetical protein